ncbi:multicopper oxidase domain-containing protein [Streptomyces sp. NPDC047917]|uniref:multicopper oxidase domain-containing protein n=1 Tax=Streptomyces sp. NPDC047917 TaxID=3365491 RepID=UPI003713A43A
MSRPKRVPSAGLRGAARRTRSSSRGTTTVKLAMRFDGPADPDTPYMYHCHLLYHEDLGMMGSSWSSRRARRRAGCAHRTHARGTERSAPKPFGAAHAAGVAQEQPRANRAGGVVSAG